MPPSVTDEFVKPTVIIGDDGTPLGTIRDGDAVIFTNFRNDRVRELTHALLDRDFAGFARGDRRRRIYTTSR